MKITTNLYNPPTLPIGVVAFSSLVWVCKTPQMGGYDDVYCLVGSLVRAE